MTETKQQRRPKQSIADELKAQGIELKEGETAHRWRDIIKYATALRNIATQMLPTSEARTHFARCIRVFKPYEDEYNDERSFIQKRHLPRVEQGEEGQSVAFIDPLGMAQEYADFDRELVVIKLPGKIKGTYLPVNSKAAPENEKSLAIWQAELGPLFEIDLDVDPNEPQKKADE